MKSRRGSHRPNPRVRRAPQAGRRKPEAGRRKPGAAGRKPEAGNRQPAAGSRQRLKPASVAAPAAAGEIDAIRKQLEAVAAARPPRWNANPDEVRRAVLKLVLTLVELIRQVLERQAIRRMDAGTLTDDETENVGRALMQLQDTILDLAKQFDIDPSELNLDLGPIGKLL